MQQPITTHQFRFRTTASPAQVWAVLAAPRRPASHYYGMDLTAEWAVGGPVELRTSCGEGLVGEVLAVEPARLLTHTIGESLDEPAVYVTWELDRCDGATVVRVLVDEVGGADESEVEAAWFPVLEALQADLAAVADADA